MIEIPLVRGFVALVDDADAELVGCYKWHLKQGSHTVYAIRKVPGSGKRATGGRRQADLPMHRFLTGFELTDHVNGNGLDNRRVNLRPATISTNNRNVVKRQKPCTSIYKGVFWHGQKRRWRAAISPGRYIHLGTFGTEVDAAIAYDAAAREYFGEFATLNFPRLGERSALA